MEDDRYIVEETHSGQMIKTQFGRRKVFCGCNGTWTLEDTVCEVSPHACPTCGYHFWIYPKGAKRRLR